MSATADFKRYEEYFSELGREEKVERIYISNLAAALQSHLLQTKVKYLENVSVVTSSSPGFCYLQICRQKDAYSQGFF